MEEPEKRRTNNEKHQDYEPKKPTHLRVDKNGYVTIALGKLPQEDIEKAKDINQTAIINPDHPITGYTASGCSGITKLTPEQRIQALRTTADMEEAELQRKKKTPNYTDIPRD